MGMNQHTTSSGKWTHLCYPSAPACKIMKGIARHAVYSFEFGTNHDASMLFFSKPCFLTRASATSSKLSQCFFANMDANALQASIAHMLVLPPHAIDIWMYMQCRSEPYSWKLQGTDEELSQPTLAAPARVQFLSSLDVRVECSPEY